MYVYSPLAVSSCGNANVRLAFVLLLFLYVTSFFAAKHGSMPWRQNYYCFKIQSLVI